MTIQGPGPVTWPQQQLAAIAPVWLSDRVSQLRSVTPSGTSCSAPASFESRGLCGMESLMATAMVKTTTNRGPAVRSRAQDVDRHVGARMRERRMMLGLTQNQLAELIGVTYQQAHKYEKGINRIASGRLYDIAQALGVDVDYFFQGMGSDEASKATPVQRMLLELARRPAGRPATSTNGGVEGTPSSLRVPERPSEEILLSLIPIRGRARPVGW
jgi:transcriptional regulator with XRE-family HTH domain